MATGSTLSRPDEGRRTRQHRLFVAFMNAFAAVHSRSWPRSPLAREFFEPVTYFYLVTHPSVIHVAFPENDRRMHVFLGGEALPAMPARWAAARTG